MSNTVKDIISSLKIINKKSFMDVTKINNKEWAGATFFGLPQTKKEATSKYLDWLIEIMDSWEVMEEMKKYFTNEAFNAVRIEALYKKKSPHLVQAIKAKLIEAKAGVYDDSVFAAVTDEVIVTDAGDSEDMRVKQEFNAEQLKKRIASFMSAEAPDTAQAKLLANGIKLKTQNEALENKN